MFDKIKYIFAFLIWIALFYSLFTSNNIVFLRFVAILYAIGNFIDVILKHIFKIQ
jgi:hypothetical protein